MFVYSSYRRALFKTNTNEEKKIAHVLEYEKWEAELFNKNCEWNRSSKFCISLSNYKKDIFFTPG